MKFTKPSLTIQRQIEKLEGRGMSVPDKGKADHYLQHISYYRLRAYWLPFEVPAQVDGEHKFADGTSLDDAISLYVFDRQLRLLVMDAIERVEVSLRGAWAYRLAIQYGPHGYLDPALYARSDQFARALNSLLDEIDWSKDTFIKHYKTKYDDPEHPPIWMISEIMSLGQLSKWYSNLKARADRQAVAKVYGLDEKVLASCAHHLTYVRNICAHHGRLWNKQFTVTMKVPNAPSSLRLAMNPHTERRLYNTLAMLGYLMGIVAPTSDWRQRLRELVASCDHAKLDAMGFPDNWLTLPAWKPPATAIANNGGA
ncbi:DNA-binding protein [Devosia sp. Root436]|uniref:Abi family protein n=1 Tax=Devosia sp. Root436 TaxID=1736537 RepID=UPI0006F930E9|nr:Abi family protein [Devosia sp. Root436]KQX35387.1 DNA-binding protein [Devosia sp. Root436]